MDPPGEGLGPTRLPLLQKPGASPRPPGHLTNWLEIIRGFYNALFGFGFFFSSLLSPLPHPPEQLIKLRGKLTFAGLS